MDLKTTYKQLERKTNRQLDRYKGCLKTKQCIGKNDIQRSRETKINRSIERQTSKWAKEQYSNTEIYRRAIRSYFKKKIEGMIQRTETQIGIERAI